MQKEQMYASRIIKSNKNIFKDKKKTILNQIQSQLDELMAI